MTGSGPGAGHFVHTVISALARSLPQLLDSGDGDFALLLSPTWRPVRKTLTIDRLSNLPLLRTTRQHLLMTSSWWDPFQDSYLAVLTTTATSSLPPPPWCLDRTCTCQSHSTVVGGAVGRMAGRGLPCQRPPTINRSPIQLNDLRLMCAAKPESA